MPTLAITGSSGFLGKHLISACLSQGDFKLRLLLRNPDKSGFTSTENVTICEGDLLDPVSLNGFLKPDCTLIHLAYINKDMEANMQAVSNLISAAKEREIKRVVHCSTAVVVGFKEKGIITEDTVPRPAGEYQLVKYQIEKNLLKDLLPDIELAILRPTEIIGPGGQGLLKIVKRLCYANPYKNFIYHSILKHRRFNYVSVHNVVAALMLLATTSLNQKGEIYNISDDDDNDNNYAAVEKIINFGIKNEPKYALDFGLPPSLLSFLFKFLPSRSPVNRIYSNSKISNLGYKKVITLRSAILEILSSGAVNAYS